MGYCIFFSLTEPPQDKDRAWEWLAEQSAIYYEDERELHPVLKELHDILVSRFPCISMFPHDRVAESVWSSGPLIENFGHDLAVVAFELWAVDEVLPYAVASASRLGITVFDQQTMYIYWPDNKLTVN